MRQRERKREGKENQKERWKEGRYTGVERERVGQMETRRVIMWRQHKVITKLG